MFRVHGTGHRNPRSLRERTTLGEQWPAPVAGAGPREFRIGGDQDARDIDALTVQQREVFDDDPENGIYWGPPDPVTGRQLRWSRIWSPWR